MGTKDWNSNRLTNRAVEDMSGHHTHLQARRWAYVRRAVFARDNWRCRRCGRAGRLECDHVVPLHRGGDPYDPGNLQTLCRPCHIDKTAGENTRPDPERDAWRALVYQMSSSV